MPVAHRRDVEAASETAGLPQLAQQAAPCCAHGYAVKSWLQHESQSNRKLRSEQNAFDLAAAWALDLSLHIIRRRDYRGRSTAVSSERLKLGFDGLTTPGLLFAASGIAPSHAAHCVTARARSVNTCWRQGGIRSASSRLSAPPHEVQYGCFGGHHGVDPPRILCPGHAAATRRMQSQLHC